MTNFWHESRRDTLLLPLTLEHSVEAGSKESSNRKEFFFVVYVSRFSAWMMMGSFPW